MHDRSGQLVLPISVDPEARWSHWVSRAETLAVEQAVKRLSLDGEGGIFLWGAQGVGKSHLLQTVCAEFSGRVRYLPLASIMAYPPEALLEGAESETLVLIDDLHRIQQHPAWEEQLFHCFNRCAQSDVALMVTSRTAPAGLTALLPDLQSRCAQLTVFKLPDWEPDAFETLLQRLAASRGLMLRPEVARYVALRIRQTPAEADHVIKRIDQSTLAAQRSPTIPFLKSLGF